MMGKNINKIGETGINTFGSEMVIVGYRMNRDIDVYFPEYDWIVRNVQYGNFKKGNIKCPYKPSICGIGYIGEGEYKVSENGKQTKCYNVWYDMMQRCYDTKHQEKHPTYKDCKVSEEFHNFQDFGEWFDNNYYEIEGEKMCLDKDILVKHNKIYSPDTCVFVPQTINNLFVKRQNARGESVIGTTPHQGKYRVQCWSFDPETGKSKSKYLGVYDTQEKAFEIYKYYKEKNIKIVADYFKGLIPQKLYKALYNYEVEITD
jgi:hypothetical protein|nr:MAG TPA: hypothetical protein [Caudoviricetes sp.]